MFINLENLQAGNVVVLRDGTEHVIEAVIFTCPVQLAIAEDRERFHTVYLKFAEEDFDASHLYGLNGHYGVAKDPFDIVEIRGLFPKVYVAILKYGFDEQQIMGIYHHHKPTCEQLLEAINNELNWKTPITLDEDLIRRVSKLYVDLNNERYNLNNMQIALNSLIEHTQNAILNFDDYVVELQEHGLERGLWK